MTRVNEAELEVEIEGGDALFDDITRHDTELDEADVARHLGPLALADDDEEEDLEMEADGEEDDAEEIVTESSEVKRLRAQLQRLNKRAEEFEGSIEKTVQERVQAALKHQQEQVEAQVKTESLQAELEKAIEDEDAKEVARLTAEISRAHARPPQHDTPEDIEPARTQQPTAHPRVQKWLKSNDWFFEETPEARKAQRFARKVANKLQNEGYLPEEDDYWELMDKNLTAKHPDVVGGAEDDFIGFGDEEKPKRKRRREAGPDVAPVSSQQKPPPSQKRRRTISKAEQAQMRMFKLDPSNNDHVKAWIANHPR